MSQTALTATTARGTARPSARRVAPQRVAPLRLVPSVAGRPGTAVFATLCLLLLTAGLLGILALNTSMAEGSYRLHALEATSGELADTQEVLGQAIDAQGAPAALATRARQMGMVPADSTAYLRLADGKVLGVAEPAEKDTSFVVVTNPSASSAARAGSGPGTTVVTRGTITTTTVVSSTATGGLSTTITTVDASTGETTATTVETPAGARAATQTPPQTTRTPTTGQATTGQTATGQTATPSTSTQPPVAD